MESKVKAWKRLLGIIATLVLAAAGLRPVAAEIMMTGYVPVYAITDLGILKGTWTSRASDVNGSGQVAGDSMGPGPKGFFYTGGGLFNLGTFGGWYSSARAVNSSGWVAGWAENSDRSPLAFFFDGAFKWSLGLLPGGSWSMAFDIDNSGRVVGDAHRVVGAGVVEVHAFLWTAASGMQDLGTLGGPDAHARGINDLGEVVGYSTRAYDPYDNPFPDAVRAFRYSSGVMQGLDTLGGTHGKAFRINNSGQVVGMSQISTGQFHACTWFPGTLPLDLVGPAVAHSQANDINNEGVIVGLARVPSGVDHAFIWTPGASGTYSMSDLNTLLPTGSGWELREATGISDTGHIVGWGFHSGAERAFRLTQIQLMSLGINPKTVTGGGLTTGTVTLNGVTPKDITVNLSSSSSLVTVPSSVIVPAGSSSVTFAVSTSKVKFTTIATVTASYNFVNKTANVSVQP